MTNKEVFRRASAAMDTLVRRDRILMEDDASERCICHRLAVYLERQFPRMHVDCEYNRAHDATRMPAGPKDKTDVGVFPDIIVHKRGHNRSNLLVVEMKKSNGKPRGGHDYDIYKLKQFTSNALNYQLGLLVVVSTERGAHGIEEVVPFVNGRECLLSASNRVDSAKCKGGQLE